jgi:hypothetical protein
MSYFGVPIRNGLPIGLGSVAGFGVQQFSPADLFSAGEQGAWYDPSDFSTLFTDSAGTTPVTGVEQFVGRMNDKSGRGNHATSTGTKRPKLAARYNLLTRTEEFDNGYWLKTAASITANTSATTDPLGGNTADAFVENSATSAHAIEVSGGVVASAISYVFSIYAKYNGRVLQLATNLPGSNVYANFDLQNGTLGSASGVTSAISSVGNGWYRCSVTVTAVAGTRNVYPCTVTTTTSGFVASYTGNGVDGVYLWGADLRPASQATGLIGPTYQRVVDAATYDAVGFLPYLSFDGIDDSMLTGSINFTATDKMTVWAGVGKQADPVYGCLAELSANDNLNNGAFSLFAPALGDGFSYAFSSRGTVKVAVGPGSSAYPAPNTNVATLQSNISGPIIVGRVNASQVASSSSSQGTGNFGNYPLFIGQRGGSSLPFNGWLTSLIVRGAQSTQSQIEATESWVNGKTGAY